MGITNHIHTISKINIFFNMTYRYCNIFFILSQLVKMIKVQPISEIDQYVIDFVKNLRSEKELKQEDIANILGVTRSFIQDIENPKRRAKYNLSHINLLADYFSLSPRDFLPASAIIPKKATK